MTPLGDPRIAEVFYVIVGGVMAAAIAGEALGDVVDEPGGSILCDYRTADWWALQPSIVGGPMQPASAWLPSVNEQPIFEHDWRDVFAPVSYRGEPLPRSGRVDPPDDGPGTVAPVPVPALLPWIGGALTGIGATFFFRRRK